MERRFSRRSIFGSREMSAVSALIYVFPKEYDINANKRYAKERIQ